MPPRAGVGLRIPFPCGSTGSLGGSPGGRFWSLRAHEPHKGSEASVSTPSDAFRAGNDLMTTATTAKHASSGGYEDMLPTDHRACRQRTDVHHLSQDKPGSGEPAERCAPGGPGADSDVASLCPGTPPGANASFNEALLSIKQIYILNGHGIE